MKAEDHSGKKNILYMSTHEKQWNAKVTAVEPEVLSDFLFFLFFYTE